MFWSLAPLVIVCVALAGLVGTCSFRPNGPTDSAAPVYDAVAALRADAAVLDFPVRLPELPADWQANSGARGGIESGRVDATGQRQRALTTRVGYLAPSKMYVSLTQSNADEAPLVASLQPEVYPTGVQEIGGVKWVAYEGGDGTEPVWTTRLAGPGGAVQLAVTGAGSPEDFRTLAAATQAQPPITPDR